MLKAGFFLYTILMMLLSQANGQSLSNTWNEVKALGGGTLVIAYSENSPFIFNDTQGNLAGIEFEIIEEFVRFIEDKYDVIVHVEYEHLYDFESLLDTLKNTRRHLLGIASISSLEERKKEFKIYLIPLSISYPLPLMWVMLMASKSISKPKSKENFPKTNPFPLLHSKLSVIPTWAN